MKHTSDADSSGVIAPILMKINMIINLQMLDELTKFHIDGRYSLGDIGFESVSAFIASSIKNCKKKQ